MRFIVIEWDQIRLSQRRVRLHAKLGRCHHSGKERLRSGLTQLGIGGKGGKHNAGKAFRGHDCREGLFDLPLHLLDVGLHGRFCVRFCRRLRRGFLDHIITHHF